MISPQVTILMPAYNAEKFIKTAVDGILRQTYTDFELLVINDGSKDNTSAILKTYNDPRLRVIHQDNMGVSRSLNKGLKLAKGEYIRRHDADDFSEPDMLEMQMDFLEKHPEIPMVSTQCVFMTERGKVSLQHRQPKNTLFKTDEDHVLIGLEDFIPFCPVVHGTVLVKKFLYDELGGYRTEFLTSEDNDLWLRVLDKYPIAVLNAVPYYLRLSGASATQIHKSSTKHFRGLALAFAEERKRKGSDPLMRGEEMPEVLYEKNINSFKKGDGGKNFRSDILNFSYRVAVGAKDVSAIAENAITSLKAGWKLKNTYRGVFFPLLGNNLVNLGVFLKKKIRF